MRIVCVSDCGMCVCEKQLREKEGGGKREAGSERQ